MTERHEYAEVMRILVEAGWVGVGVRSRTMSVRDDRSWYAVEMERRHDLAIAQVEFSDESDELLGASIRIRGKERSFSDPAVALSVLCATSKTGYAQIVGESSSAWYVERKRDASDSDWSSGQLAGDHDELQRAVDSFVSAGYDQLLITRAVARFGRS